MSTATATKKGTRGLSHYLRGRAPGEVTQLLLKAVDATGGAGARVSWAQVRDYFVKQGMARKEAEAFTGELLYEGAYTVPAHGGFAWARDVGWLLRHRTWRFPRGQMDLPAALRFVEMVESEGGPKNMPPYLASMYERIKVAVQELD